MNLITPGLDSVVGTSSRPKKDNGKYGVTQGEKCNFEKFGRGGA